MPNMSRRSLEHHNERVNIIAKTDPVRASFLRSRYESFTTRNRTARAADNFYDSQDEIDLSNGKRYYYSSASQSWIRRLLTVITTIISSAYYRVTDVFRSSKKQDLYYSRLGEQKKGKTTTTKLYPYQRRRLTFLIDFQGSSGELEAPSQMALQPSSVTSTSPFLPCCCWTPGYCVQKALQAAKRRDSCFFSWCCFHCYC